MLDLAESIPGLSRCTTAVITGSGPTLKKYCSRICDYLRHHPEVALFDLNGNLASLAEPFLRDWGGFKIIFGLDYRICEPVTKRIEDFLTLPNARFVVQLKPEGAEAPPAEFEQYLIGYKPIRPPEFDKVWQEYQATSGTLLTGGGTLSAALTAVPSFVGEIHLYGCDSHTIDDFESIFIENSSRGVQNLRPFNRSLLRQLSAEKNLLFAA